jgi:putative endonuclease
MNLLARAGFSWIQWKSRRGLLEDSDVPSADAKYAALRVGVRGETYAYWYLRRQGYIFIARNYEPAREKGELDLVGFDGDTLAFVEVRTRAVAKGRPALPELSITREKHEVLVRTAHAFLRERHIKKCPVRFDVVAIDHAPGKPPEVRLRKAALSPKA